MKAFHIILYIITTIAIGAVSDGLAIDGSSVLTHILEVVEKAMFLSCAFVFTFNTRNFIALIVVFVSFNIALFDPIHNYAADLDLLYVGTTSLWDNALSKVLPMGVIFARIIFLALGVGVTIKELND